MVKGKWVLSILLIGSLIGLAGCAEKEMAEKVTKLPKQAETKAPEKQIKEEEPKPIVVNVIDPNTKKVIKTFRPLEMGFDINQEAYKKELEQWAKELARGNDTTPGYDQRMELDKIKDGKIIKGKPQVILEESELVERVLEASINGGDVELPIYVKESGYNPDEILSLDDVVLASFTTFFNPGVVGRSKNIELSADAIDYIIVGDGDIFSFNTTVGPSDAANGYQKAKEIVNKKLVDGIGGGICQTSSTLFNAIDKVGVSYIEKHHHSLSVGYVPAGRDATVSYGGKDFRFQNTTGVPLLIKTVYQRGKLTVEIRTSTKYKQLYAKGN
ncbi:VanW family protein [Neobacillus kokaensis]|uniref:Lipoprotein n=1 Tax=Neobacillus kokaensis TaxID=2759023 RepID=A0ABQ3N587_9BACI|nr:VanW family protein [Neobacillus kokaensis]GHH99015.1 lipoprotein [Neobacillus kokaensis]